MASEKYFKAHASSFTAIAPANLPGKMSGITLTVLTIQGFRASAFAELPYMVTDVNGVTSPGTRRLKIMAVDVDNDTVTLKTIDNDATQINPNLILTGDLVQPRQPKANLKGDVLAYAFEVEPINAIRVMTVDESGNYVAGGGGGGGGGGDATAANQAIEISRLSSIDGKLTNQATAVKQDAQTALLTTIESDLSDVSTATKQDAQTAILTTINASAAASATAVKQDAQTALLTAIDADTSNIANSTDLSAQTTHVNVIAPSASHAPRNALVGGIYKSAPPVLTNGQQSELQVDSAGNLRIAPASAASGSANEFENTIGLAPLASITHTLTVGADSLLTQVEASSSGQMKVEVKVNSVIVWVKFNTAANLNITFDPKEFPFVASGDDVDVVFTSMEITNSHNVYSTISTRNA